MVKKILIILISGAVLFLALILLLPTEKDRFKQDIKAFRNAIEDEQNEKALLYISPDYKDGNGMVFATFTNTIEKLTREFDSIKVTMSGLKVYIDSINEPNTIFAHCSLGLRIFARYQGEKTLLYGGIVKPASVKAWFKKTAEHYQLYDAIY